METRLSIARVGVALSLSFALLYGLCVGWDAIFPDWAMRTAWVGLLPGFDWLSVGDFLLGLFETALYGWIAALIFVPIWNALNASATWPVPR